MRVNNTLRDHRVEDSSKWRRLHGLPISTNQLQVLKAWQSYCNRHIGQPSQAELAKIVNIKHSEISRWFSSWEEKGIIERGTGHRNHRLTQAGIDLINEISELDGLWEQYLERRTTLARRLDPAYSGETADTRV